jgi:hypothetical protein
MENEGNFQSLIAVVPYPGIVAINRIADTSAIPTRQANAAGMMACIIWPPDATKLVAGRQLCSDVPHTWAQASVEIRRLRATRAIDGAF